MIENGIEYDMDEILPGLWVGACWQDAPLPDRFDFVVSLFQGAGYKSNGHSIKYSWVMADSQTQPLDEVDTIAELVNALHAKGTVLVHCQGGLNRSALVVARALMLTGNYSAFRAISLIRFRRNPKCLMNSHFENWLLQHENVT